MSAGCKSCHSGFLDVSRSNGGLWISDWISRQLSCLTIFSTNLSVAAFLRKFVGLAVQCWRAWKPWERCRTEDARDEAHGRGQLLYDDDE